MIRKHHWIYIPAFMILISIAYHGKAFTSDIIPQDAFVNVAKLGKRNAEIQSKLANYSNLIASNNRIDVEELSLMLVASRLSEIAWTHFSMCVSTGTCLYMSPMIDNKYANQYRNYIKSSVEGLRNTAIKQALNDIISVKTLYQQMPIKQGKKEYLSTMIDELNKLINDSDNELVKLLIEIK